MSEKISACLWFDHNAEEAVNFYCSVFKNSSVKKTARYGEEGQDTTHMEPGTVMTIEFEVNGQSFLALNAGPVFKFNEAGSFIIYCKDQEEVDYYWNKLTADGGQESQCGWLKDKFGLSWQVTPTILPQIFGGSDKQKAERAMKAMMQMKKIDVAALENA